MSYELYQEQILDHYKNPRNLGEMVDATVRARGTNPVCGDELTLYLKIDGRDRIKVAQFSGRGCAISQASASMLTVRLEGMAVGDARKIGKDTVLADLGVPVSDSRMECALLPLNTLASCLNEVRTA